MAKIVWVLTGLTAKTFSGGTYCILKHAHGLAARGHEVVVTTLQAADVPQWFPGFAARFVLPSRRQLVSRAWSRSCTGGLHRRTAKHLASAATAAVPGAFPLGVRQGIYADNARDLEDADITIATSFETAFPVHLHGKGKKFYFCQHFEPYFANEFDDPSLAHMLALDSYRLPLNLVTNSQWLSNKLHEIGRESQVVHNAVDERMFVFRSSRAEGPLRLISYGGRGAQWKGFADIVKGVAMARRILGEIDWSVYGPSDIPADNRVSSYTHLGFLNQADLAQAYAGADVMVSASWYESFPLFPLEAMAAGTVAVTTLPGAEAYARHLDTAFVIPPQDPGSICEAIVTLARNRELAGHLAAAGREEAKKFSWQAAVDRMEQVLLATA